MAEDQCLIQYVRDNFGDEFIHNFVNIDGDVDTFGLDYNTFTESSTFADHSSPVTTLAPELFGSPSSPEAPAGSAMESTVPYLPNIIMECSKTADTGCYSPPGEPGLQVPSVLHNLHNRLFDDSTLDHKPLLDEKEYPMLASYGLAARLELHGLEEFGRQQAQGFEGNITLDEMLLQDQFVANCDQIKSTNSELGERAPTSFWRGKSPAVLMQQLKGPSMSASSSSSEPRSIIRSPSNYQPLIQQPPSNQISPTLAPNLTGLISHRSYRSVGDMSKSYTFGAGANSVEPIIPGTVSKSAPTFSRQRPLPPLGDINNIDVKFKNILSPGRSCPGQRVLQSSGSFKGDVEMQQIMGNIKQRRKIMPALAILGEMQLNAASQGNGNNSWSSSSTSPRHDHGPSSNIIIDHDKDQLAANFDLITTSVQHKNNYNSSAMSIDREMGGDRVWKKAKGELGSSVSEDTVQAAILATAMVEQKEKNQLREKFLALLQIDSSTSKDYKAQILDDTIRYLKDLRRPLNFNEAVSSPHSKRINIPESPGFQADDFSTEASPTTSSRCRPYGEGLASPVRLKDLELETAGVEMSPHLTVDSGPHIEVRMMENQHMMVKLTAKDRPGLFNDIVVVLRSLRLDIQHANIRTGNNGQRHNIFAAKMQLPFFSSQSTHSIAMALNQVINASATSLASLEPHTQQM